MSDFIQFTIDGVIWTYVKYENGTEYVGYAEPGNPTPMWPV